jgi:plastocyanin
VLVREAFGDRAPVPGALVELFTSGGSVGASAGVTGADGVFATTAQADGSDSFLTVDVEARLEDAGPVLATGQARALVTQPVNGCSPGDYVDRTDAAASRAITINFGFNPRCMIVKEGQQVTYQSGSAVNHPIEGDHLGGSLGDFQRNVGSSPSAVGLDEPGDYAVDCKAHPTERSALRVVP